MACVERERGRGEVARNCQRGIKSTTKETGKRDVHPEDGIVHFGYEELHPFEKKGVCGGNNGKRAAVGEFLSGREM
jgi:hypothetical protein